MRPHALGALAAALALFASSAVTAGNLALPAAEEQLVEGHTVFAVLQKPTGPTAPGTRNDAATDGAPAPGGSPLTPRFNGTLWFNDQFLVAPSERSEDQGPEEAAAAAILVRDDDTPGETRYPCGGAVLAVNHGDPDPRQMLLALQNQDAYQGLFDDAEDPYDSTRRDTRHEAAGPGAIPHDGARTPGPSGASQPQGYGWVQQNDDGTLRTTLLTSIEYAESYLVTDPNDHAWIVDRYDAVTTVGVVPTEPSIHTETVRFPLWVVNVGGGYAFAPDDGQTSCPPTVDDPLHQAQLADLLGEPRADARPLRLYNALVYARFGVNDLRVNGRAPHGAADTDGCAPGTAWTCPADDPLAEGNSHAFAPAGLLLEPASIPGGDGDLPVSGAWNDAHGAAPWRTCSGGAADDAPGATGGSPCHPDEHAAHNRGRLDLYFSGTARPLEPPARLWAVLDYQGSNDPFHEAAAHSDAATAGASGHTG